MTQTQIEELEAYIAMMELDFEAKVWREIDQRLPVAVDAEISRRSQAKAYESGEKHGKWIKDTFSEEPAVPTSKKFGQDGLHDVDCDF